MPLRGGRRHRLGDTRSRCIPAAAVRPIRQGNGSGEERRQRALVDVTQLAARKIDRLLAGLVNQELRLEHVAHHAEIVRIAIELERRGRISTVAPPQTVP